MVKVKVLGISGSPRHGNTEILVKEALEAARELGDVETEFVSLADKKIAGGCMADYACYKPPSEELLCRTWKDDANEIYRKMLEADGIIIGTPVYWSGVSAQLKALFDRSMSVEALGMALRNRVGGAICGAYDRHGGHEAATWAIHCWMMTHDMIIVSVGPERPARSIGGYTGAMAVYAPIPGSSPEGKTAVKKDEIGMAAAKFLGKRVTEVARVVKAGLAHVPKEELAWPAKRVTITYMPGAEEARALAKE